MTAPMTRYDRAALITRAKRAAGPVASCVAARIAPSHLIGDMTRDELAALVIVLAEAADHALLREVTQSADDGTPAITDAGVRYRQAHAEAARLRAAGEQVPNRIRVLESAYQHSLRAGREAAAAADPEAARNRDLLDQEVREHARSRKAVA